jgi:nucleotide-binding universal stress UspA family protein
MAHAGASRYNGRQPPMQHTDLSPIPSGPFSRIIVAVDASPASDRAARLAISLARADGRVELVFLHAIDVHRMLVQADRCFDDFGLALAAARDAARGLLDRCCALARAAGVFARSYVREGKPASEIVWLAGALGADLVVIGNSSGGKLRRILCGSIRDDIVRASSLPVLVADLDRPRTVEFSPRCIVAPLEDAPASQRAVRLAADIAKAYAARLVLVSAAADGRPPAALLNEVRHGLGPLDVTRLVSTQPWSGAIERAVVEHQPDLVVMGVTPQPALRGLVCTTIAERLLHEDRMPLLVVRGEPPAHRLKGL